MFQINKSKENKSDEVSNYVMAEMQILAHGYVLYDKSLKAKNLPCIGTVNMYHVSNRYTKKSKDSNDNMNVSDKIKYGIKKLMYYSFRSAKNHAYIWDFE